MWDSASHCSRTFTSDRRTGESSVYANSSPQDVRYVLEHSDAVGVLCEDDDQRAKVEEGRATLPRLTQVLTFADQNSANLAVSSGRAQVGFADSQIAEYVVAQSNGLK